MMTSNNALVPDPDKEDILASKPFDWPFLQLGLRMCGWGDLQLKYYLLGNPVVWWGSSISLFASVPVFGVYVLRMQRKYVDMEPSEFVLRLDRGARLIVIFLDRRMGSFLVCRQDCVLWLGAPLWYELCQSLIKFLFCSSYPLQFRSSSWAALLIFIIMFVERDHSSSDSRLISSHQLPTLYFAVLMFGHLLDHFIFSSRRISTNKKWIAFGIVAGVIFLTFWWFKGLAFGITGPMKQHWGLQWRKVCRPCCYHSTCLSSDIIQSWNMYN